MPPVLTAISEIASIEIDDGVTFDLTSAKATSIRTEDMYPGARVTMCTQLWTARTQFHVDVNVGDPIHPPPNDIEVPRAPVVPLLPDDDLSPPRIVAQCTAPAAMPEAAAAD